MKRLILCVLFVLFAGCTVQDYEFVQEDDSYETISSQIQEVNDELNNDLNDEVNCDEVCEPYYNCIESHGCTSQNNDLVSCREENCQEEDCEICEPYSETVGLCTNFECIPEAEICAACG